MAVEHFTKTWLRALPTPTCATVYYDAQLAGFGLRLSPSSRRNSDGTRSWFVEYRPSGGGRGVPSRRMVFGDASKLDNPEEARRRAKKLLAAVELGSDPAGERQAARRAESVSDLIDSYLREHVRVILKPRTAETYEIYARRIRAAWGSRKALSITRGDVQRLHRKIGIAEPDGEGKPGTANRLVTFLSGAFTWASKHGALPEDHRNPAKGVARFSETPRERFLSVDEFGRLGETLSRAETIGLPWEPRPGPKAKHAPKSQNRSVIVDKYAVAAIHLLVFSGCRLREILNLRWADIDFDRGLIILPDSKTGRRPVVLGAPALHVLTRLERIGVYVVAGESAGTKDERPRADLQRPWAQITKHAKLEGLRIHDLRHSFASVGAAGGLGLPVLGRLLGHADASTTARYAHLADDGLRRAADAISRTIEAQLNSHRDAVVSINGRG